MKESSSSLTAITTDGNVLGPHGANAAAHNAAAMHERPLLACYDARSDGEHHAD